MSFDLDYSNLLIKGLPAPSPRWNGFPKYNFIGGHNDTESIPIAQMVTSITNVLEKEGASLATYGLQSGPQGYKPLREFIVSKVAQRSGLTTSVDNILITSGSGQGLDLVNSILCEAGDTVIVEQFSYGSAIGRLRKLGVNPIGVPLNEEGMRLDLLVSTLMELQSEGIKPKYLYVIPTIQNPGGSIMPEKNRRELLKISEKFDVPILEDECYADLLWDDSRPPALAALDDGNRVIHCGSFSKTIAPALRVGYLIANWDILSQILAVKSDGGTGALEQMMLAEYCKTHFDSHVTDLCLTLENKLDTLVEAVEEHFGVSAEFQRPRGGIFLWITLPENVDTIKLAEIALKEGIALNPGPDWSSDAEPARSKLRLCFGHPSKETIREGVKKLAKICHSEFGIPLRSSNKLKV
ncbi:MAG: aminotransferase [Rhodospirillaceae bacterium]|nr:aminotransferase [Rhodospirillaceae bacterium]